MSSVTFASPSGSARLSGRERAWCAQLVNRTALGLLDPRNNQEQLRELLALDHTARGWKPGPEFASWYATYFTVDMDSGLIVWHGHALSPFRLGLNTALQVGGDVLKLAARLHGACELHAWVDGPDRAWLAGIIEVGLTGAVLRRGEGWGDVVDLLLARDDEPVVTSYSVTDGFPNPDCQLPALPRPEGGEDYDAEERFWNAWEALGESQQWCGGMRWLREQEAADQWLQIRPGRWAWPDFHFGEGLTVLDLIAPDRDERLARALGERSRV